MKLGQGNIFRSLCQEFCPQGDMHDRGHAWQGACMAGGMHGRGKVHAWQGGIHDRECVHGRGACSVPNNSHPVINDDQI